MPGVVRVLAAADEAGIERVRGRLVDAGVPFDEIRVDDTTGRAMVEVVTPDPVDAVAESTIRENVLAGVTVPEASLADVVVELSALREEVRLLRENCSGSGALRVRATPEDEPSPP